MDDHDILERISRLVQDEHQLESRHGSDVLSPEEREQLQATERALDQCWDLLRQRRARRSAGQDPDEAHVRGDGTVEGYQQ